MLKSLPAKALKKFLFGLLFITTFLFSLSQPSNAAVNPSEAGKELRKDFIEHSLGSQTNETLGIEGPNVAKWSGDITQYLIINAMTISLGKETLVTGEVQRSGVLGQTATMAGNVINSPPNLQTMAYMKRTLSNNIFSPPTAYAAGADSYFGSFVDLWQICRNISYLLITILLLVIGLMIMFRAKVDPRTTITLTNALPRVIISLLLITFSYAIAGLIVDLGLVFKALIDRAFVEPTPQMYKVYVEPFHIIRHFIDNFVPTSIFDANGVLNFLSGEGNIYLGGTGVSSTLIALVFSAIAIIVSFILFFTLIFRYASLFAQVIFSPLAFAWGSLPGQEDTIINWFKGVTVSVFSFPVIYLLLSIGDYIANATSRGGRSIPMPKGLGWGAMFGQGVTDIGGLVAFGFLIMATRVPAALEDILEVEPAPGARGGVEPTKIASKIPIIGSFF